MSRTTGSMSCRDERRGASAARAFWTLSGISEDAAPAAAALAAEVRRRRRVSWTTMTTPKGTLESHERTDHFGVRRRSDINTSNYVSMLHDETKTHEGRLRMARTASRTATVA